MNCKPGELAVIVSSGANREDWALGRVVRCTTRDDRGRGPAWNVEPPLCAPCGRVFVSVLDYMLRPIRDPGDDATDESLAWLPPVPKPEILALPVREMGERYA